MSSTTAIKLGGRSDFSNASDRYSAAYSLTDNDIMKLVPDCEIITYDRLKNLNEITDLFKNSDKIALLYHVQAFNSGHWVCLVKDELAKMIFYFDSYGEIPDEVLDHVEKSIKNMCNQNHKYLSELILESGYSCDYSPKPLQKMKRNINTCGRFIVGRMINSDLTNDEYSDLFGENPDNEIIEYTNSLGL